MSWKKKNSSATNTGSTAEEAAALTLSLEGKKRVSVQSFKGKPLLHIREFYVDKADGTEKPGKKGIALTPGDWRLLKTHMAEIDLAMESLEGSRRKAVKSAATVEESADDAE